MVDILPLKGTKQVMATKLIVIGAVSVAAVLLMFVLGKMADGKQDSAEMTR